MDEIIQAAQRGYNQYTLGKMILASGQYHDMNTRKTGLNNNLLILGVSGSGKTRTINEPNILQMTGSYVILDTKGQLNRKYRRYLERHGYRVLQIDFTEMEGTVGYNPLKHIREGEMGELDILRIASALCPIEDTVEPFWDHGAAGILAALIALVLETQPKDRQTLAEVCELAADPGGDVVKNLVEVAEQKDPNSFAARKYRQAWQEGMPEATGGSFTAILGEKLRCMALSQAKALYRKAPQVDFASLGHERTALFVTVPDCDNSLKPLVDLFVNQAFQEIIREADRNCGGWLPVPVMFMLDDFANLHIDNFPELISVMRSRNVQCMLACQSISQLRSQYGADAETILGNCSNQVVLRFVDPTMAEYFAPMAGKTATTLLHTPRDMEWVFTEGMGRMVPRYELTKHPLYPEIKDLDQPPAMGPAQRA